MLAPTAEQYNELKARYEALRSIRETEPEAHATQMATTLEDTQRNSQVLITQLRGEIERLRQNEKEFASAVTMAESLDAENAELRKAATPGRAMHVPPTPEKAVAMQKAVAFYEMLTGLTVSVNGSQVHCSCGGEQRPLSFEIDLAPVGDENNEVLPGDIGFTAKELGDCADRLPDYMQDYLTCARARVPPPPPPSLPSALAQPHPPTPPSPAFLDPHFPAHARAQSTGCKRRCCCRSCCRRASVSEGAARRPRTREGAPPLRKAS